jgi:OTU domain-containing protein 3
VFKKTCPRHRTTPCQCLALSSAKPDPPPQTQSAPARRCRCHDNADWSVQLITDPAQSTLQLTNQLRALGLYAAPTLGERAISSPYCPFSHPAGDGNCLFRALADQLWGSPNGHLTLRTEVCDWMEARKERYEGFVDDDRTFDSHIRSMRVPGLSTRIHTLRSL